MNKKDKHKINKELSNGKEPILMGIEEIKQVIRNPLSKSRHSAALKRKMRKPRPSTHERIICDVCGNSYTQSNVSHHKKSKHHIFCLDLNKKMLSLIYD